MEEKDKWIQDNGLVFNNPFDKMIVDACYNNGILDASLVNICVAISRFETGNYTSFVAKNNFGGMLNSAKTKENRQKGIDSTVWYYYKTPELGVNSFVNNLNKNYFKEGRVTIDQIGEKYAPNLSSVDPVLANPNWIPSIKEIISNISMYQNDKGEGNADPNSAKVYDDTTTTQERSAQPEPKESVRYRGTPDDQSRITQFRYL